MAALPEPEMEPQYGVDPETMTEMPMGDGPVDPGMPPADPMLAPVDEYEEAGDLVEVEEREKVELCLLGAIESCAKACEVGVGASNPQFVASYGQAAAALAQAYEALTRSELAAEKASAPLAGPSDTDPSLF